MRAIHLACALTFALPHIGLAQSSVHSYVAGSFGGPFDATPVVSNPFTAEAITEIRTTLADGTVIVDTHGSLAARDSNGRTRHEALLLLPETGQRVKVIFIGDGLPTANDAPGSDRTSRRPAEPTPGVVSAMPGPTRQQPERQRFRTFDQAAAGDHRAAPQGSQRTEHVATAGGPLEPAGAAQTEPLGTEVIEGVTAAGTRTVLTIPAGEVGNDRPLRIVDERWYSSDVDATVLVTHSDPRVGESTYRLTNIQRVEPADSLFDQPSTYTVGESRR
jgi:hypothetical protein